MTYFYQTDVGCRREVNQDSLLLRPDLNFFAVADGLGGHKGGEIASALALSEINHFIQTHNGKLNRALLGNAFTVAGKKIHSLAASTQGLSGMCTTLSTAWLEKKDNVWRILIGQIGDTRCYLITENGFWQLTKDHSWIAEQVSAGLMTREEAKSAPGKNILVRSVGIEPIFDPDIFELEVQENSHLLLCSDGLYNKVPDSEIARIIRNSPKDSIGELIDLAKKRGGEDNISAILLDL